MKVMCIDDTHWVVPGLPCPKFGEITTVKESLVNPTTKIPVYTFLEYPPPPGYAYRWFFQKYFCPLSDIDEVELVIENVEVIQ